MLLVPAGVGSIGHILECPYDCFEYKTRHAWTNMTNDDELAQGQMV